MNAELYLQKLISSGQVQLFKRRTGTRGRGSFAPHCCACGKKIDRRSKMCYECAGKARRKVKA